MFHVTAKHAIKEVEFQLLATTRVTTLLPQRFLLPHGTDIPLVG